MSDPIREGDRVRVPGDPHVYTVQRLVQIEDTAIAVFLPPEGWWRASALEKVA